MIERGISCYETLLEKVLAPYKIVRLEDIAVRIKHEIF